MIVIRRRLIKESLSNIKYLWKLFDFYWPPRIYSIGVRKRWYICERTVNGHWTSRGVYYIFFRIPSVWGLRVSVLWCKKIELILTLWFPKELLFLQRRGSDDKIITIPIIVIRKLLKNIIIIVPVQKPLNVDSSFAA